MLQPRFLYGTPPGVREVDLKTGHRVKLVPDADPAPARKVLENAVPSSEAAGKHSPLGTSARYPKHRFDEVI